MDNIFGYNMMPPTLLMLLSEDVAARERFMGMGDDERHSFLSTANRFQSKEEMERYLYHKEHDNFK
jgi:hypothetical protein